MASCEKQHLISSRRPEFSEDLPTGKLEGHQQHVKEENMDGKNQRKLKSLQKTDG